MDIMLNGIKKFIRSKNFCLQDLMNHITCLMNSTSTHNNQNENEGGHKARVTFPFGHVRFMTPGPWIVFPAVAALGVRWSHLLLAREIL